ncbi:hypothetical protein ABIF90_000587 [Bradyrhizobium japonicum]
MATSIIIATRLCPVVFVSLLSLVEKVMPEPANVAHRYAQIRSQLSGVRQTRTNPPLVAS